MYEKTTRYSKKQKIIFILILSVLVLTVAIVGIILASGNQKEHAGKKVENNIEGVELDADDPLNILMETEEKAEEIGASVNISEARDDSRTGEITYGIDVSVYQGTIDWQKVAQSGIDFAMIRVGYRAIADGTIKADTNAKYNMQEATKYGVKVGVYFFSTAVSKAEAIEEAEWVADYIAKYQITYPVVYDCEGYNKSSSRQYSMTNAQRTDVAIAFMEKIAEFGYSPMFYAAKSDMENNANWEMNRISSIYSVWVAQYPAVYTTTTECSYSGPYIMWQYTNKGTVSGVNGSVDMNIAYFGYTSHEEAKDNEAPEEVEANVEALMNFKDVNETVTAKEKTNLRDIPSQGSDSKIMATLVNGQTATRTGISDSGWSRIIYNGNKYYAVSSLLTTDLDYKVPQEEDDDGIVTEFQTVNEQVTAKEAVNLRLKPSVDDAIAPIIVQIKNGDVVTRTGINTELGWSRVVYNGQTLYCISSYLMLVE